MSASARLLAAPRRRAECLSAMAVLQTRSAAARGPKPARASMCLRAQATGGPRSVLRSSRRPLKPQRASVLTIVAISPRKHSGAANFGMSAPAGRAPASRVSSRSVSLLIRRRVLEPKNVRWILQPARPPKVLLAPTKTPRDANTTRRDALQDAAHRDTSRQRRAIASRGSRTRGQPPSKKIEPGQP